jgi:2-dehydropantoate 2-reductase
MKILVMGDGAVGSYFGARLGTTGEIVTLYGRGDHLRAMREQGFAVKSIRGDVSVAVKATAMRGCLAEGGAILTLQNGVENEARLAANEFWAATRGSGSK